MSATTPGEKAVPAPAPGPRPVLWYDLPTPAGRFTLSPVKPDRDLPLIVRWMNDPEVARYWALDGPAERTVEHVRAQLAQSHVQPLLARLSGRPIGYWELYEAARDRIAEHYPARPDDMGVHLLIGEADCRGIGLGSLLLRALGEAVRRRSPRRLVAEPDERNVASVHAFANAGFVAAGTITLPEKRAVLMLRQPTSAPAHPQSSVPTQSSASPSPPSQSSAAASAHPPSQSSASAHPPAPRPAPGREEP